MRIRGSAVYDYRGAVIFFLGKGGEKKREVKRAMRDRGRGEERARDARDISNFLITPRGANDLPLVSSLVLALS